jgi:hypothetical protein
MAEEAIIITIPAVSGDGVDAVVLATTVLPHMPQVVTSTVVLATEAVVHYAALCAHRDVCMVFALLLMCVSVTVVGQVQTAMNPCAIQHVRMVVHVPLPMCAPAHLIGQATHVNSLFVHLSVRMAVPVHHLVYVPVQLDGRIAGVLQI